MSKHRIPVRPRVLRRRLTLAFLGAIIAGAVLGTGIAKADPESNYAAINESAVCSTLDQYPTIAGVKGVLTAIEKDGGWTPYEAGTIVADAVMGWCPNHLPELRRFVAIYAPQAQTASTGFGPHIA